MRKDMSNVLQEINEAGLELAQDTLPTTRLEKFYVVCRNGHRRLIHMKDIRRGRYCSDCRYDNLRRDHWEVFDVLQSHNIRLNESFRATRFKHSVECVECGYKWESRIDSLLSGARGCPSCAVRGFKPDITGYLYYLKLRDGNNTYYKIGITNKPKLRDRFCPEDYAKITCLRMLVFKEGRKAFELEQYYLNLFKEHRYQGPPILKSSGNTELFTQDILGLDTLNQKPL